MITPPHCKSDNCFNNSNTECKAKESNRTERIIYLDLLKFFAIFLVVWGHAILFSRPSTLESEAWQHNGTLQFIYSFHMPLFMMLTGFVYAMTLKSSFINSIKKKFRQLIIPSLTWGAIIVLIELPFATTIPHGNILVTLWHKLWFLKSAFFCGVVAFPVFKYHNKTSFLWIIFLIIAVQFVPETTPLRYVFMLPFFLMGGLIYRCNHLFSRHLIGIMVISGIIFWSMIYTCTSEVFIKFNHYSYNWEKIIQYPSLLLYRIYSIVIGTAGSLFFISLFQLLFKNTNTNPIVLKFATWGQLTLGIYTLHCVGIREYCRHLFFTDQIETPLYSYVYTPLFSILILTLCISLSILAKRNRWTAWLLMGARCPRSTPPSRQCD